MSSHPTLRIIRNEHGVLVAVLRSIELLLAECRRHGRAPDFTLLRAMLFYIDEFPERVHHPKESELLFPRIRQRTAARTEAPDRLKPATAASPPAPRRPPPQRADPEPVLFQRPDVRLGGAKVALERREGCE